MYEITTILVVWVTHRDEYNKSEKIHRNKVRQLGSCPLLRQTECLLRAGAWCGTRHTGTAHREGWLGDAAPTLRHSAPTLRHSYVVPMMEPESVAAAAFGYQEPQTPTPLSESLHKASAWLRLEIVFCPDYSHRTLNTFIVYCTKNWQPTKMKF